MKEKELGEFAPMPFSPQPGVPGEENKVEPTENKAKPVKKDVKNTKMKEN